MMFMAFHGFPNSSVNSRNHGLSLAMASGVISTGSKRLVCLGEECGDVSGFRQMNHVELQKLNMVEACRSLFSVYKIPYDQNII